MKHPSPLKKEGQEISSVISSSIGLRAGKNFFWMLASEGVAKGTIVVMNIYIARVLTPSSYGIYAIAQSVALYLTSLVLFGTGNYGQRQISRNPKSAASQYVDLMGLRFISAAVIFGLFILFISIHPMPLAQKALFFASLILPFGTALKPDWVFIGLERIQYLILGNMALAFVLTTGTLLLVKGPEDTLYAIVMRGAAVVASAIVLTGILTRIMPISLKISVKRGLAHLKECFYFGISIVSQAFTNELVILISGIFLSNSMVGKYAAPHRISVALTWIAMMFGFGFYPVLSSRFVQSQKDYKRTFLLMVRGALLLATPVLMIGMNFSRQITSFLLGPSYAESAPLMLILFPCFLIDCLAVTFGFSLMAAEKQKYQTIALVLGFGIMFLLGVIMIPQLGVTGAALAYLLGKLVSLSLLIGFFSHKIGFYIPERSFFLRLFLAVGAGFIPVFLPGHWFFRASLSFVFLGITVFLTGILAFSQIKGLIKNIVA